MTFLIHDYFLTHLGVDLTGMEELAKMMATKSFRTPLDTIVSFTQIAMVSILLFVFEDFYQGLKHCSIHIVCFFSMRR